MSTPANWQEDNARYLSAAIAWLRSLLEQRGSHARTSLTTPPPQAKPLSESREERRALWRLPRRREPAPPALRQPDVIVLPRGTGAEKTIEQLAADMTNAAAATDPPPALVILAQRLGLSSFEQDLILLCAALELDTSIASLCAHAQGESSRPYPTFALALTLFDDPAWDALSPERPLRYLRLIEINQPAGLPLTVSPLRADERIVNYLKGINYLDDRLGPMLSPLAYGEKSGEEPASQHAVAEKVIRALQQTRAGQNLPVIQLLGHDPASKEQVAAMVSNALGQQPYRLHSSLLPAHAADLESFARLWQRESLLLSLALVLDTNRAEGEGSNAVSAALDRLLARISGVVFLDTRDLWAGVTRASFPVDVAKPTAAEQHGAWTAALGEAAADNSALLTGQFNLDLESIREIARKALAEAAGDKSRQRQVLWDSCLAATRPRMEGMAQRLAPKATWDDIVLPAAEAKLLRQIADQVGHRNTVYQSWGFAQKMSRGLGISALFAGPSGSGKTMAAEVLANQLRLNLYRIDLSATISKYIGETEKNIRRLFDAAEDGGALLFFDEADALFGKRSEVKDSHDRYANIEINYLLQRMESYGGLAILATNMKSALDPAFLRRLRFVVSFPFPGQAERKAIWQKVFPPQTPAVELDFERLSRLHVNGGNIHSIALNAAFMAAGSDGKVNMHSILDAARIELRKLGQPINESDFLLDAPKKAVA